MLAATYATAGVVAVLAISQRDHWRADAVNPSSVRACGAGPSIPRSLGGRSVVCPQRFDPGRTNSRGPGVPAARDTGPL